MNACVYSNGHLLRSDIIKDFLFTVNSNVFTYLIQIIAEQCKRHVIKLVKTTTRLDNNLCNTSNNPAFMWDIEQVLGQTNITHGYVCLVH